MTALADFEPPRDEDGVRVRVGDGFGLGSMCKIEVYQQMFDEFVCQVVLHTGLPEI